MSYFRDPVKSTHSFHTKTSKQILRHVVKQITRPRIFFIDKTDNQRSLHRQNKVLDENKQTLQL